MIRAAIVLAVVAVVGVYALPPIGCVYPRELMNQHFAAATLHSGILPAENQFRQHGLAVEGVAATGRYAYAPELLGLTLADGRGPFLPRFTVGPSVGCVQAGNDYAFTVYLPDGPLTGGDDAGPVMRRRHFVAYAWPTVAHPWYCEFAITETGIIYSRKIAEGAVGRRPPWNALMGGKDWGAPVAKGWTPYQK